MPGEESGGCSWLLNLSFAYLSVLSLPKSEMSDQPADQNEEVSSPKKTDSTKKGKHDKKKNKSKGSGEKVITINPPVNEDEGTTVQKTTGR